jgi:hypothetical protein
MLNPENWMLLFNMHGCHLDDYNPTIDAERPFPPVDLSDWLLDQFVTDPDAIEEASFGIKVERTIPELHHTG